MRQVQRVSCVPNLFDEPDKDARHEHAAAKADDDFRFDMHKSRSIDARGMAGYAAHASGRDCLAELPALAGHENDRSNREGRNAEASRRDVRGGGVGSDAGDVGNDRLNRRLSRSNSSGSDCNQTRANPLCVAGNAASHLVGHDTNLSAETAHVVIERIHYLEMSRLVAKQ